MWVEETEEEEGQKPRCKVLDDYVVRTGSELSSSQTEEGKAFQAGRRANG